VFIQGNCSRATGPGNIGPQKGSRDGHGAVAATEESADDTSIWEEREVPDIEVGDSIIDPRERPEYEIKYRQAVTPEDAYLQV